MGDLIPKDNEWPHHEIKMEHWYLFMSWSVFTMLLIQHYQQNLFILFVFHYPPRIPYPPLHILYYMKKWGLFGDAVFSSQTYQNMLKE